MTQLPRFDSTLKMNAGTAVLSVALGKNQGLIAIVEGQEEDEEVSHVVESQVGPCPCLHVARL